MGERARDLAAQIMSEVEKLPNRASVSMASIRFDSYQNAWWDIDTAYSYREPRSLNSIVRKEEWPYKEVVDTETGKMKQVLIKPSEYTCIMDNNQTVDNSTWWPGLPTLIEDKLLIGADLTDYPGKLMFNTYRPPPHFDRPKGKKKADASLWINHIKSLWPDPNEHDYFLDLCAHMIQRPAEKVNAIVVLSGEQGIGKDMALVPVKAAIGVNNVRDISPDQFASPYNPWVKCIMLVINELRPAQEDYKASAMYDMLKQISVTPPDTIAVNDKYLRMQYVVNVLRIFITTNDMHSIYISPNDRRMLVLHSSLVQGWQDEKYFERMAEWFTKGDGIAAVANYLADRDISKFKPKAKPFTTIGKQSIVNGWGAPDDAIGDALDRLKKPDAFFATELYVQGNDGADEIMNYLRQSRKLMHRMRRSGYFAVPFDPPLEFRGSRTLRFKTAFVKDALIREIEHYTNLLQLRGTALAEEKVSMLHAHQPSTAQSKGF